MRDSTLRQTDGYGHMIVNDTTSKKGSLTIPDLQMTLSNNNFADIAIICSLMDENLELSSKSYYQLHDGFR